MTAGQILRHILITTIINTIHFKLQNLSQEILTATDLTLKTFSSAKLLAPPTQGRSLRNSCIKNCNFMKYIAIPFFKAKSLSFKRDFDMPFSSVRKTYETST